MAGTPRTLDSSTGSVVIIAATEEVSSQRAAEAFLRQRGERAELLRAGAIGARILVDRGECGGDHGARNPFLAELPGEESGAPGAQTLAAFDPGGREGEIIKQTSLLELIDDGVDHISRGATALEVLPDLVLAPRADGEQAECGGLRARLLVGGLESVEICRRHRAADAEPCFASDRAIDGKGEAAIDVDVDPRGPVWLHFDRGDHTTVCRSVVHDALPIARRVGPVHARAR